MVKSDDYEEDTTTGACLSLTFEYTPNYPDEPPLMEITPVENIEDEELEELRTQLVKQVWKAHIIWFVLENLIILVYYFDLYKSYNCIIFDDNLIFYIVNNNSRHKTLNESC